MSALSSWGSWLLYGPSADERLQADEDRMQRETDDLRAYIRDKHREASKHETRAKNAMLKNNTVEARSHFAAKLDLEKQCARLEKALSTLTNAGSQLKEASANDIVMRANESAANAMQTADQRMPITKVRHDAMRLQRLKDRSAMKREMIDEALSMADDDDDSNDEQEDRDEQINKLMEATALSQMPVTGSVPSALYSSSLSSSSAAAAASSSSSPGAALPELRPLAK